MHDARHKRQSEIAGDPSIPLRIRQMDLNHKDPDMQFAYQHVGAEQKSEIISKVMNSPLRGKDLGWLCDLLGDIGEDKASAGASRYRPGLVQLVTPRWRKLIENNPAYIETNSVKSGICSDPKGPSACGPYQNAMKAADEHRKESNKTKKKPYERAARRSPSRDISQTGSAAAPERGERLLETTPDVVRRLKHRLQDNKAEGYEGASEQRKEA
jgi:hypothetical protein